MVSQELFLAELMMSQVNERIRDRMNQTGARRGYSQQIRRFLGWASLRFVALGARLVHYGLQPHSSYDGQGGIGRQGASVA